MKTIDKSSLDMEMIEVFIGETLSGLDRLNPHLFELEQKGKVAVDAVYRWLHTVKGSAAYLYLSELEFFSHKFESLLKKLSSGEILLNHKIASLMLKGVNLIQDAVENLRKPVITLTPAYENFIKRLVYEEFIQQMKQEEFETGEGVTDLKKLSPIKTEKETPVQKTKTDETIRIGYHYLDDFTRRAESLVMNCNYLKHLEQEINPHLPDKIHLELSNGITEFEKNINSLQKSLFSIRSSKLAELFQRVQRILIQLESDLGKMVVLKMQGENIEVDRSIIGILAEPLIHLVRNAMDHGLEPPEQRKSLGKPEAGTLTIDAVKSDEYLTLTISDDGNGIDAEKVLKKATELGMAVDGLEYTPADIYQFLLEPGFTMAEKVTSTSGRGVGMDVVLRAMRKQGGSITITSDPGKGSSVVLNLPTRIGTLTKNVLLVEVDNRRYAINHDRLRKIVLAENYAIIEANHASMICHNNELIHMVDLGNLLHHGVHRHSAALKKGRYLIIEDERRQIIAVRIDRTLNRLQAVIKPFDHNFLKTNPFFEGTVVAGMGHPTLVLSLKDISLYRGLQ